MKLATQTYIATRVLGFEEGIKAIKRAGFDSVDMSLFRMDQDDNEFVKDDWKKVAKEYKSIIDQVGIPCSQAHAPHIFEFGNDSILKEVAIPRIKRSIEIASIMGAHCIVIHPLHHLDYKTREKEIRELNIKYMKELVPVAKDLGVIIGFENMWQRDLTTGKIIANVGGFAKELAEDVDKINSDWVKVCLDVGHCSLVGEEAKDAIHLLGKERIIALHVHDNDYCEDLHTLPYLGKMNWAEIMKALSGIGYEGDLTYEADNFLRGFDVELLPDALKFMDTVGRHLIKLQNK
jgi:sugar phosphate isomerase/epimerase